MMQPNAFKMQAGKATEEHKEITGSKLLDGQDLLMMFHISVRTLQGWRKKGVLPYSKIGRKIFYTEADVAQMLLTHKVMKK